MKIQDHIYHRNGQWYADYKHRTTKSPERNYGTGTTHYMSTHKTGWEAVMALQEYCLSEGIAFESLGVEWGKYYADVDRHISYMEDRKPKPESFASEAEYNSAMSGWQMAYSCDEPDKPGYERANND